MRTKLFLFFGAVVLGLALTASPAAAKVNWNTVYNYDEGHQQALAAQSSGLVVEFHRTNNPFDNTLWYHVGRLEGTTVQWGPSHRAPADGAWPNVALTQDGIVLFAWSKGINKSDADLLYKVGKLDLHGDNQQTIHWLTDEKTFDSGFHSSLAMNDHGVIVEVHESGSGGSGMYYRVGRFADPASGNYDIVWESGSYGRHYDNGINPHIAINNNNQVVEVHQVPGENLLHYRRGVVLSGGIIDFRESHRYHDYAYEPAVALLDNGQVLEMHGEETGVYALPGVLSHTDPSRVNWSWVARPDDRAAGHVAVTTNGTHPGERVAIGTWPVSYPSRTTVMLNYAVGEIQNVAP